MSHDLRVRTLPPLVKRQNWIMIAAANMSLDSFPIKVMAQISDRQLHKTSL